MEPMQDVLRHDEQVVLRLRSLYREHGYSRFRMSRFEEYGFYSDNKEFLTSGDILTFTDANGKLMALRPDVTLSIVKNFADGPGLKRLYYNENVYRSDGHGFKEQMQAGLECMGEVGVEQMAEVVRLAISSLELMGLRTRLDISHMGLLSGLMDAEGLPGELKSRAMALVSEKNAQELRAFCDKHGTGEGFKDKITKLISLSGSFPEVIKLLRELGSGGGAEAALSELEALGALLAAPGPSGGGRDGGSKAGPAGIGEHPAIGASCSVNLDFSIVNNLSYYNGIIFQGYIEGIHERVLSGGRYDTLMRRFGKRSNAVGFAVYLDLLERIAPRSGLINIALPKGRLGEKAYSIFEASGYACPEIREESRKLVFESPEKGVRYFWVKPSDVIIYVERGVADIGVVGKDVILESEPDVYELLDLGIGKCGVCVAAKKGFEDPEEGTLRVATKFPAIARGHYAKKGMEIDVIKLNGSVELAPLLGLSDVIVDIVETGATLRENGLEVIETITGVSARLVANKASCKFCGEKIGELCRGISENLHI